MLRSGRAAKFGRWYRDPALPVPRTEITRFPHGVLEVKLSLPEGQKAPEWVQDLLESGYLTEARPFWLRLLLASRSGFCARPRLCLLLASRSGFCAELCGRGAAALLPDLSRV